MNTEFEASVRIRFWGDRLDIFKLTDSLTLDKEVCRLRSKGEEIVRNNAEKTGSIAKTSFVSYTCTSEFPELIRDPQAQFSHILRKLQHINGDFPESLGVTSSELQLSLYYNNQIEGDVDFIVPTELQVEMVKKNIGMRITALP